MSRKRVQRLMRAIGISGLVARKRGRTTIRVPASALPTTSCSATFAPLDPTCCGSPTSRISGLGRAGSTWPPSKTLTAAGSGIAVSTGSRGDCFDNAVAESFFATLKKELVHRRSWPTRRELTSEVFEYVEAFYNTTRRHSTLGYLSPAQFETESMTNNPKING